MLRIATKHEISRLQITWYVRPYSWSLEVGRLLNFKYHINYQGNEWNKYIDYKVLEELRLEINKKLVIGGGRIRGSWKDECLTESINELNKLLDYPRTEYEISALRLINEES